MSFIAAAISIGSQLYGAYKTSKASGSAGQDPFGSQRGIYQDQLHALMTNPDAALKTGAFKSSLDLGLQSVARSMGPEWGSGKAATALMSYGQGAGLSWISDQEKLLATLSGATMGPPAAGAGVRDAMQKGPGRVRGRMPVRPNSLTASEQSHPWPLSTLPTGRKAKVFDGRRSPHPAAADFFLSLPLASPPANRVTGGHGPIEGGRLARKSRGPRVV
jgi:hypothetical protein